MKDTIKQTIYEVEKLAVKFKKKLKRNDIDFNIQVSLSTTDPGQIYYALQFTSVAEGVAPITFIKKTPEDLITAVQAQLDSIDTAAVEKAYHESQINHAKRTITFHEERIEEIDKEKDEPQEGEVVQNGKSE
jgi:hypothetical protein